MNRKNFLKQTFVAMTMLSSLTAGSIAQAQTTLTMSSWVPPTHFLSKDILQPWMADVEKATEGRVTIKMLPKAVGSPPSTGSWHARALLISPGATSHTSPSASR